MKVRRETDGHIAFTFTGHIDNIYDLIKWRVFFLFSQPFARLFAYALMIAFNTLFIIITNRIHLF